jgi:hypothetical protein
MRFSMTAAAPVLAAVALWATPAGAAGAEQDLAAAEQAYVDMDFDKANTMVEALSRRGGLTHEQLVRTYKLLGRTHAILNHEKEARDAFVLLLTVSPDEREDRNLPPRVVARMQEARGVVSSYAMRPGVEASASLVPGDGGSLRVTTRDPTHVVRQVVVGWRWGAAGPFSTANVAAAETVEQPLSSAPPGAARLDYYAQAIDDRNDVVFEAGSAAAPKTALVPVAPAGGGAGAERTEGGGGKSVFASPVFWIVTGVVLAGAGTGVYFATRKAKDETTPPSASDLSPVLVCGMARCQ